MAKVTPDLTEAVELASEPMPVGTYPTRITSVEVKKSQAGNDYLKAKHTVFGLEGELAKFNNWPVFSNYMLSGKGTSGLKQLLGASDIDPKSFQDSDMLLGKEVKVTIAYEVDQRTGEKSTWPSVKAISKI